MRRISAAAIAAITCAIAPSNANWQYTKWGMSPEQALAAPGGQMKKCDTTCSKQRTDTETALTYAKYRTGEFSFTAFAFYGNSSKKLEYVQLELDNPTKAYALLAELKSKYGEPTSQSNTQLSTIASWRGSGDQVQIIILGLQSPSYATITYRPRMTSSNKGL